VAFGLGMLLLIELEKVLLRRSNKKKASTRKSDGL